MRNTVPFAGYNPRAHDAMLAAIEKAEAQAGPNRKRGLRAAFIGVSLVAVNYYLPDSRVWWNWVLVGIGASATINGVMLVCGRAMPKADDNFDYKEATIHYLRKREEKYRRKHDVTLIP